MSAHKPAAEPLELARVMTADLYAMRGWFPGGECVDHVVRGERIVLGKGPNGRTWLFSRDRRYALTPNQRYDVLKRSRALAEGE